MKTKIKDSFDQVWATASTSWIPCWSSSKGTPGSSAPLFGSASSGWVTGPSDFSASTVSLSTSTEELAASSLSAFIRWSTDRALWIKGRSAMTMDMKHKIPRAQTGWRFQEYFGTTRERKAKYKIKHAKFPHKTPKSAHWLAVFWMLICGSKWQSFPPISKVLQHARCKYNVVQTYSPCPWTLSPLEPKTTRRRPVTRSNQIASGLEIITASSYRHGDPHRIHSLPTSVQASCGCLEIYYGPLALGANDVLSSNRKARIEQKSWKVIRFAKLSDITFYCQRYIYRW